MRNSLGRFLGALALATSFGCAPMGYMQLQEQEDAYYFDSAAFAAMDGRTVLALSVETKQSWESLATTRDVWIVFPGQPAEGSCEIEESGCSLRYAENLGLALGMICAAQTATKRGACEIPEDFGQSARSGSITVEGFVEGERLKGRFDVMIASGPLTGAFEARFDPLAALELTRLLTRTP